MPSQIKDYLHDLRPHLLPLLLLAVLTAAVYGRMLGHDFLSNWDDNRYILENPDVQGFSWEQIKAIFTRYYVGNYAPVHLLSYMFDHAVWGLWPGGFLLTNLVLHGINTLLLYRLLIRLVGLRLAAWSGATLFLVHPVQVESVAWISQRKNLLAMLFFLLAWQLYLAYRDGTTRRRQYYWASLAALLVALLAKSIAVIFPLVILLFDVCYPATQRRLQLLDKIPYFLMALAAAVLALLSQAPDHADWGAGGGRAGYHGGSPMATLLTMLPVFCTYLRLIVWPVGLSALYNPQIRTGFDLTVLAALLFLGVILFLGYRLCRDDRRIAFWFLYAAVALMPVSQIVPLVTIMNDRYLYFPLLGVAALAAYAVRFGSQSKWGQVTVVAILTMLLPLSVLTFKRVAVWRDAATLWRDTVSKVPDSYLAWEGLGESLEHSAKPQLGEAIVAYKRAIELNPASDISRYNLGVSYRELNDYASSERVLTELLQRSPDNVMGWAAFGDLALRRFEYEAAETSYRKALSLQPEAVQVHQKIGNLMVILGRLTEARSSYLRIEELQKGTDPVNAYELARVAALAGDTGAAIKWLEAGLQRGYNNFEGIMNDEELLPIMADGRFAELMNRYFPGRR